MKSILKFSIVLLAIAIMNGCSNNKNDVEIKPKAPQQASALTEEQKQAMQVKADKIVNESISTLKKPSQKGNLRDAYAYEVIATDITAKNGCNFSLNTYVRAYSLLDATGRYTYNSYFCAQTGHLRYAIVYNLNSSGTYSSVGSFVGPVGGCLSGGSAYTVNAMSILNTSTQIVIFDVNMASPAVSNFVYSCFSNPRHLDCNGPSY